MRLTKIVPALALVAAVAAPSAAIELADGALTIKGDVELEAHYKIDEDSAGEDESKSEFKHDFDLYFIYTVGDDVEAWIELEESGASSVKTKQAALTWGFADNLSLTAGLFDGWLYDTDAVINGDFTDDVSGDQAQGLQLDYSYDIDDSSSISFFAAIVESIWRGALTTDTDDMAYGLGFNYANDAFGWVAANYNVESVPGEDNSLTGINIAAGVDVVEDFEFGSAIYLLDADDAAFDFGTGTAAESALIASVYAAYSGIPTSFPSEAILQVTYADYDRGTLEDVADVSIQGAYFFKPTSNKNFIIGAEIKYVDKEARGAGQEDEGDLKFSLEIKAKIP